MSDSMDKKGKKDIPSFLLIITYNYLPIAIYEHIKDPSFHEPI